MKPANVKLARVIALFADLLQISIFPYFGWGGLIPLNAAFDVVVCLVLSKLIGWHIAFLPSFLLELTPGLTLAPSWSIAVMIATRNHSERAVKPGPEPAGSQVIDV